MHIQLKNQKLLTLVLELFVNQPIERTGSITTSFSLWYWNINTITGVDTSGASVGYGIYFWRCNW